MAERAIRGAIAGGAAAVAVAGAVAFAVPAAASAPAVGVGHTVSSTVTGFDNAKLCERLKKVEQKRQAVQARLQGDAKTRGSIEWLKARAAAATASGEPELARLYTDKAALRSQLIDPLRGIDADLQAIIAVKCG
jgi:hypothetical protein